MELVSRWILSRLLKEEEGIEVKGEKVRAEETERKEIIMEAMKERKKEAPGLGVEGLIWMLMLVEGWVDEC